MTPIGTDQDMFDRLKKEISLISSSIERIDIYNDDRKELAIDITFGLIIAKRPKTLLVCFRRIKEFVLYHNDDHYFYNVVNPKILKVGEHFYLSFDPDEDTEGVSDADNDYILAGSLNAFWQ